MSLQTSTRPPNSSHAHSGLPFHKFLSTLNWLKNSHLLSDKVCSACSATTNAPNSASQDVANPLDNLVGCISFRIGYDDFLWFAPENSTHHALSCIPATLAVADGQLRIAIHSTHNSPSRCLTANLARMFEHPSLHNTDKKLSLEMAFPFVTLTFHCSKHVDMPGSYDAKFETMKHAISELRALSSSEEKKEADFVSLVDLELQKIQQEHNRDKTGTALSNFVLRAALMTVPPSFPYRSHDGERAQKELEEENHIAFVDAFLEMQVARNTLLEEANGCVAAAAAMMASHKEKEDVMLTAEEIGKRRNK